MTPPQFDVQVRRSDEKVTVMPIGELDIATAEKLRQMLRRQESRGRLLQLDLSQLEFIDLVGLRVVLEEQRRARSDGFGLRLTLGTGPARRLFDLIGGPEQFPDLAD
jgi:anti-anti-sigma factor